MNRLLHASAVFLAYTALTFAQPPAAGNGPGAMPGPGRGAFAPIVIGPRAPVPPQVAIPRPTPTELVQINDTLKRLIDSDQSPAKAPAEEI